MEPARDRTAASDTGVTPAMVAGEIEDFVERQQRRRRLVPRALAVGVVAGAVAVGFRVSLEGAEFLRNFVLGAARRLGPIGLAIPVAIGAGGAALAVFLVRRFAPEAAGSGIPHLKAVLHALHPLRWKRLLPVKFVAGTLGIGAGLALGREGPTVQMGGAVGQMIGEHLRTTPRERQVLTTAGAGAGLAAAFNAPLAGVIFTLEEIQRGFAPGTLTAGFVSCVSADVVARLALGQLPVFHVADVPAPPLASLPWFVVVGVVAGMLGVAFNRSLLSSVRVFERFRGHALAAAATVGALIGLAAWFVPESVGGGQKLVESALDGRMGVLAALGFFMLRFVMTMASYGTGAAGGIFAPLLVLGSLAGVVVGAASESWSPALGGQAASYAVAGMAALFAAIVRAPLTGIVLILEMTANYGLMLPLLACCLTAYGLADFLRDRPIYEALPERDLMRGRDAPRLDETLLVELSIEPGALFEGRRIDTLGLPPGCLIVAVRRGLSESVPTRDTVLRADDHLTVVIGPAACDALPKLRAGARAAGP